MEDKNEYERMTKGFYERLDGLSEAAEEVLGSIAEWTRPSTTEEQDVMGGKPETYVQKLRNAISCNQLPSGNESDKLNIHLIVNNKMTSKDLKED